MDEYIQSYFDKGCESFNAYTNASFTNLKERRCWQRLYSEVFAGEGEDVLNVGCGPGTEALVLADMGFNVTGLDFSTNMVDVARYNSEKYGVKYEVVQGDAMDLPFEDGSFDFIASNYALWAIPDPEKAMEEWLRVLRPGGKVAYVEGVWNLRDPSFFRRIWVKIAVRMRKKDRNGHTYDLTDDEKEHLAGLWSKKAERPKDDLKMMDSAGFSKVGIINKVDRRIFKGLRYIEYGYHPVHFMIIGTK